MTIAAMFVERMVHGRWRRPLMLALVGSEGDPEDIPFDPPVTTRLAECMALVDQTNATFPRGLAFPGQVDRADFRRGVGCARWRDPDARGEHRRRSPARAGHRDRGIGDRPRRPRSPGHAPRARQRSRPRRRPEAGRVTMTTTRTREQRASPERPHDACPVGSRRGPSHGGGGAWHDERVAAAPRLDAPLADGELDRPRGGAAGRRCAALDAGRRHRPGAVHAVPRSRSARPGRSRPPTSSQLVPVRPSGARASRDPVMR